MQYLTENTKLSTFSECRFVCSNRGDKCLCGTDGLTYRNTCEMRCSASRFKKRIYKDHQGPCMDGKCNLATW